MPVFLTLAANDLCARGWQYPNLSNTTDLSEEQKSYVLLRDIAMTLREIRKQNDKIEQRLKVVEGVAKDIKRRFKKIDDAAKEEFSQ